MARKPWKLEDIGIGDPQKNRSRLMITAGSRIIAELRQGRRENEVNGRLIIAAPSMLRAGEMLYEAAQENWDEDDPRYRRALAAWADAREKAACRPAT